MADKFSTKCGGAPESGDDMRGFLDRVVNRAAKRRRYPHSQKFTVFKRFKEFSNFLNRLMI
ncbi:hypothetical protein [Mesorhizobium sp. Z1-4]|uniref:hypothetical protein n=1 Tax=Mesorhizobium sp. Z1-4 TaxID=2448478 RepID=UPI000FD8AC3B|nr:hypothetical protein [Mesorhizobium sp. Z1-4]